MYRISVQKGVKMEKDSNPIRYNYEKIEKEVREGDVLMNLNGTAYILISILSHENLLLQNAKTGMYNVGVNTQHFARYPKDESIESPNCIYGIEWEHGHYIDGELTPELMETIHNEYGDEEGRTIVSLSEGARLIPPHRDIHTVLFTAGMSDDKIVINTTAVEPEIKEWAYKYVEDLENGKGMSFDSLSENHYVKILYDSEIDPIQVFDALAVKDFDEVYDFDYFEQTKWKKITSKSVMDADDFSTDYTMYQNQATGSYGFIFGDNEAYTPQNCALDYECETEREALEWFELYKGFEQDKELSGNETDLDENLLYDYSREEVRELANSVVDLVYDFDTYNFRDTFDSKEEALEHVFDMLKEAEGVTSLIYMCNDVLDSEDDSLYTRANELKAELENYMDQHQSVFPEDLSRRAAMEYRKKTTKHFNEIDSLTSWDMELSVKTMIEEMLEKAGYDDVEIIAVVLHGSRSRGLESEDSDIDFVVEYKGDVKEDVLFNLFHEEKYYINNITIPIDINPIRAEETGTLVEYLPKAEKYLEVKELAIDMDKEMWDLDPFGYHDAVDALPDESDNLVKYITDQILNGGAQSYIDEFEDNLIGATEPEKQELYQKIIDKLKPYLSIEDGLLEKKAESLAEKIDALMYDNDFYNYISGMEDEEITDRNDAKAILKNEILSGNVSSIIDYLIKEVQEIAEGWIDEELIQYTRIIDELKEFEVRDRLFLDLDGTLAEFKTVDTLETLYEEGYFLNLNPHENVVAAVKDIIENHPEIEVYIMSSVLSDSKYALAEKNSWIDKYLPEIDKNHRVFPPCGENKLDYIPNGVRPTDCLLDDYTHNLSSWEPPAKGIKLLTFINHTNESWTGNRIDFTDEPDVLANNIVSIMHGNTIKAESPRKHEEIEESILSGFAELKEQQQQLMEQISSLSDDITKMEKITLSQLLGDKAEQDKKYKLTDEYYITDDGSILYRIQALKDFCDVKEGSLGGFIESEDNLSHEGNAWVYDEAKVYGEAVVYEDAGIFNNAEVYGEAYIYGNASVSDNAKVFDYAKVHNDACVFDNAKVCGEAEVHGNAKVYGNAEICDTAEIYDNASILGNAKVHGQSVVCYDYMIRGNEDVCDYKPEELTEVNITKKPKL